MLLPLPMKIGEVRHRQHRWATARRPTEQRRLKPVIVPLGSERPRYLGSFGPLQILVGGAEANRTTSGDLPQTQAHIKLQSKNFFDLAHGQSPGWQADPPFRGGCLPLCCPAPLSACGNHSGEAERSYGIGLKLFGFIPEPVFTFIPESCSGSSRNTVRNHPGIAFILPRNPQSAQQALADLTSSPAWFLAPGCDDRRLYRLGQLVGVSKRSASPVT